MELITILNRCHRFRGLVYQHAYFSADKKSIEVAVRPRKGSTAVCSRCHLPAPGYDQLAERRLEFIPLWGFLVFLVYTMRRVDCRRCGVVAVEEVPWGDGKRTLTKAYMLFLARWARRMSWKGTAEAFRTSWDKVFDAVEHVVTFGLEHRVLGQIDAIGVDEIQYAKGHKYLTLVYQIDLDVKRLLWVGRERTIESFRGFFAVIGDELASKIMFVCSDMWEPYLKVIREKCSEALHILDRFHIVAKMNKALDASARLTWRLGPVHAAKPLAFYFLFFSANAAIFLYIPEAFCVLIPDGRIAIVDIRDTASAGDSGGANPIAATTLLTASKPSA